MTDNGVGYRSRVFADTLEAVDIDHVRIRHYRPQTNGKVERYHKTLATEWAYANTWTSDQQRADALSDWLHQYNHHRYHTSIDGPPSGASIKSGINTLRLAISLDTANSYVDAGPEEREGAHGGVSTPVEFCAVCAGCIRHPSTVYVRQRY